MASGVLYYIPLSNQKIERAVDAISTGAKHFGDEPSFNILRFEEDAGSTHERGVDSQRCRLGDDSGIFMEFEPGGVCHVRENLAGVSCFIL